MHIIGFYHALREPAFSDLLLYLRYSSPAVSSLNRASNSVTLSCAWRRNLALQTRD